MIKVCEMAYSIRDFRKNPRFSPKSEIFAKIRNFRENPGNPGFSRNANIGFAKISDFSRKSRIFAKIRIFVKISDFDENLDGFQIHFSP